MSLSPAAGEEPREEPASNSRSGYRRVGSQLGYQALVAGIFLVLVVAGAVIGASELQAIVVVALGAVLVLVRSWSIK